MSRSHLRHWLVLTVAAGGLALSHQSANAQFEGGFSPERIFGFIDRNRDGIIDRQEAEGAFGPMRDVLLSMRIERGISQKDFEQAMPRLQEEMRRRRESGGGFGGPPPGSFGGGFSPPSGGFGPPPGSFGPPPDSSRDSNRSSSSSSNSGSSSGSSSSRSDSKTSSTRKPATPKARVTVDLPAAFKDLDRDFDGQIGLYEWERARLADFLALDKNSDGILTPKELVGAKGVTPPKPTTSSAATAPAGSVATTTSARPSGPASPPSSTSAAAPASARPTSSSSGKLEPVPYDANSSEGRMASFYFKRLDLNQDGSLSDEEWAKSQTLRQGFEKAGARMSLPASLEQFAGWQVAVQKANGGK